MYVRESPRTRVVVNVSHSHSAPYLSDELQDLLNVRRILVAHDMPNAVKKLDAQIAEIFPARAHRVTVLGLTRNIAATSEGVRSASSSGIPCMSASGRLGEWIAGGQLPGSVRFGRWSVLGPFRQAADPRTGPVGRRST